MTRLPTILVVKFNPVPVEVDTPTVSSTKLNEHCQHVLNGLRLQLSTVISYFTLNIKPAAKTNKNRILCHNEAIKHRNNLLPFFTPDLKEIAHEFMFMNVDAPQKVLR